MAAGRTGRQAGWTRAKDLVAGHLPRSGIHARSGDLQLHAVAPDLYVYRGFFSSSAVLVTPGGVVVVDTQVTPRGGQRLRDAIAALTPLPIRYVINTHYHADHVGGNAAFPDAEIIATADTARFMLERDLERVDYARTFGLELQDVPPITPPTRTFTGHLTLRLSCERLELFCPGAVETADACVVWWPSHRALVAGDGVATDAYPWLGVPFLDEGLHDDGAWIEYLRQLRALRPATLIPGHGPPLTGQKRIAARLDLLIDLMIDLLETTRLELSRSPQLVARLADPALEIHGSPQLVARLAGPAPLAQGPALLAQGPAPLAQDPGLLALVDRIDARLRRYAGHPDLEPFVVSQRFAIYRAINSLIPARNGRGWWHDLRPSAIPRAPLPEADAALNGLNQLEARTRAAHLQQAGQTPLALALLELSIRRSPADFRSLALLSDLYVDAALRIRPLVDATECLVAAGQAAKAALVLQPLEPLALLTLGTLEVWSGMVAQQPMACAIRRLEAALASDALSGWQTRKAMWLLGKARQFELQDSEADRWFRRALPWWARGLYPLIRSSIRAVP